MNTQIDRIKSYLADVAAQWKTGAATELSYRAALAALLSDMIPRVTVVNEPAHIACGAPDLLVRSNGATRAPVGYVETKDIGDGDRQTFSSPVASFPIQGDNRVEKVTFQAGGGRGATALPAGENGALGDRALPAGESGALGDRALPAGENGALGDRALPDLDLLSRPSSTGRVYVNKAQYFDNVPQSAWEFFIGGYQPAQKWLKDRKGRVLSYDDTIHYKSIILALLETRRLMDAAEEVYRQG